MRSLKNTVLLVLSLAPVAFADLNLTTTLSTGQNLNLETGAVTASGGDIAFQGTSITFGANDTAYVVGKNLGPGGFALINEGTLSAVLFTRTRLSVVRTSPSTSCSAFTPVQAILPRF